MHKDYITYIEYQGVTARLKRLSDSLFYSIRELYNELELGIEPNWHLIFMLLKEKKVSSMTEISEAMNLSQPATIKMIEKMNQKGFLVIKSDSKDKRRKLIELSEKSYKDLPKFEKIWAAGKCAMYKMLEDNPEFMNALKIFEIQNHEKSFKERMLEFYKQ